MLDNLTNLKWLAIEYLSIAVILGSAITFMECSAGWGIAWGWNVPVAMLTIFLIGGCQHRLAGLAHEAAHYALMKNRILNELFSDIFCMFPIYATTCQYRLVHLGHHQFVNDWERDPDLLNIGKSKLMDKFPMTRWQFVYNFYFRFFMPHNLLRYLWDIVYLSAFGKGVSPYEKEGNSDDQANEVNVNFRYTSVLGMVYVLSLMGACFLANRFDNAPLLVLIPVGAWMVATAIIVVLPDEAFFRSPVKPVYSIKTMNILRLGYYTTLVAIFGGIRYFTGVNYGGYYFLLWVAPMLTTFAYFMLLRDVYQHANADDGRLTNTRVFYSDPFSWWAVFVYGQDMHVPHHLYPAVPHYNLEKLHKTLMENCVEYAANVVECHGVFANTNGAPTILDIMEPDIDPIEVIRHHHAETRQPAELRVRNFSDASPAM